MVVVANSNKMSFVFKLSIISIILTSVFVQFFDFDAFPFSNYPMYSYKFGEQFSFYVICSTEREFPIPSYVVSPLYPRYLARSAEKWNKFNQLESTKILKLKISQSAEIYKIYVSPESIYFDLSKVAKKEYYEYLKDPKKVPTTRNKVCTKTSSIYAKL